MDDRITLMGCQVDNLTMEEKAERAQKRYDEMQDRSASHTTTR